MFVRLSNIFVEHIVRPGFVVDVEMFAPRNDSSAFLQSAIERNDGSGFEQGALFTE